MATFKAGDTVYAARVCRFSATREIAVEIQEATVVRVQRNGLRLFGAAGAFSFRTIVQPGDVAATREQALVMLEAEIGASLEEKRHEIRRLEEDVEKVREEFRALLAEKG